MYIMFRRNPIKFNTRLGGRQNGNGSAPSTPQRPFDAARRAQQNDEGMAMMRQADARARAAQAARALQDPQEGDVPVNLAPRVRPRRRRAQPRAPRRRGSTADFHQPGRRLRGIPEAPQRDTFQEGGRRPNVIERELNALRIRKERSMKRLNEVETVAERIHDQALENMGIVTQGETDRLSRDFQRRNTTARNLTRDIRTMETQMNILERELARSGSVQQKLLDVEPELPADVVNVVQDFMGKDRQGQLLEPIQEGP